MPASSPLPILARTQALAERGQTVRLSPLAASDGRAAASPPPEPAISAGWGGSPAIGSKLAARGLVTGLAVGERFAAGDLLGAGATGRVLGLRDRNLAREIAVKVLATDGDRSASERFVLEAQIIAGLSHPNVLPVHDLDLDGQGRLYFTMSRVAGHSLGVALERSSGDARDALIATANDVVNVFLGVLRAVAYAHHRGLIHQDIKPENIMLGGFGEVILVDWGSAARLEDGRTTQLYGTPLYMSPEQALGTYADQRSDLYCLGASLFHALVLRPPTWADEPAAFLEKKRRGVIDAPSAEERRGCPPALLAIALLAMRADPDERYQSAEAMLRDLERYQAGLAVAALHEPWWRRLRRWYAANTRWFWTLVIAVAALALAAALTVLRGLEERASWMPVFHEDFSHGDLAGLAARWALRTQATHGPPEPFKDARCDDPGFLSLDAQGLTLAGTDQVVDLSIRQGITGDIRVDWDYTPLDLGRNLNCFFGGADRSAAFTFHVAGFGTDTLLVLTRADGTQLVHAQLPAALATGTAHHFSMEHAGRHLRLVIDGRTYIDFADDEAIGASSPQRFGFDLYPPNRQRIAHVQVFRRTPAQRVSPLEIGDALFQLGLWAPAEQRYQDLIGTYAGTQLATAAEYRVACCERQQGHADEAARRFDAFSAGHAGSELVPYALAQRLSLARTAKDAGATARLREDLAAFPGHPVLQQVLLDISQDEVVNLDVPKRTTATEPLYPPDIGQRIDGELAIMRRWSQRYQTPLWWDGVVARVATILWQIGDGPRMLALVESPESQAEALFQQGRFSEVLAGFPLQSEARCSSLFALGRVREAAANPGLSPTNRANACFFAGDDAGLAAIAPGSDLLWFRRLESGQRSEYAAYLAAHPQDPLGNRFGVTVRVRVLLAAGRYQQILDEYHDPSSRARALFSLGRLDEALALAPYDSGLLCALAISDRAQGRDADAQALFDQLAHFAVHHNEYSATFTLRLLPAVMAGIDGHRDQARATLRAIATQEQHWFAQRLSFLARYLAGDCSDHEFLAQPYQLMADSRLILAQGLRCEIDGDPAGAARHYQALLSLPYERSMVGEDQLAFMAWRLRGQGLPVPPCLPLLVAGSDL